MEPLISKHGDNYKAMERDIKINRMQKTARHLQTRCERLQRYKAAVKAETDTEMAPEVADAPKSPHEDPASEESVEVREDKPPSKRKSRKTRRR